MVRVGHASRKQIKMENAKMFALATGEATDSLRIAPGVLYLSPESRKT